MGDIYLQYEYWFAAFQLVFAMFGMGATLTLRDFRNVFSAPRSVVLGIAVQLLMVPVIAWLFIHMFGVVAGVAIGIALIAAIPGGTTSNIFTYFAKGNVPLSISITALTTIACLLTTPLILGVLITEYLPANFTMPTGQIISDIALTLLLPLAIGMLVYKSLPNQRVLISKWSIRFSLIGLLLIVVGSASAGRLNLDAFGMHNLTLVCAFILLLALCSWLVSKVMRLTRQDGTAIEMEVIVRNVNLAVMIKASMFPIVAGSNNSLGDMILLTALLYGAGQMILAAVFIAVRRRTGASAQVLNGVE